LLTHLEERSVHVVHVVDADIPTPNARYRAVGFRDELSGSEHVAMVLGDPTSSTDPAVGVHRHCLAGDVFGSRSCGCREQLDRDRDRIESSGEGVLIYLHNPDAERALGLAGSAADSSCQEIDNEVVDQILNQLGLNRKQNASSAG
jgi:3,4-dihydroxy 2-butanone 4-phosphate synthase/GTP cyclohydrolase II